MISTSDFRRGQTKILWNGHPCVVIEFSHVKPGKGGAFVRTKLKNLKTGSTVEATFRSGEKFEQPDLEYKNIQFLYSDDLYHFMDQESYEQIDFAENQLVSIKLYLKELEIYKLITFEGLPISVDAPNFMNLKISNTVPGVKGNTAHGGNKPATLETGLVVQVPLFVNESDVIKVDTRDNKYIERVDL
ncbi:elongation factor P [Candidatus Dependentiae bacterium]|nr:MAG: elongation factor P [Candidatus Dependentiae bacterium]